MFQRLSRKLSSLQNASIEQYPLFEGLPDYRHLIQLEKDINERISDYRKRISAVIDLVHSWRWNDPVSNMYRELFIPSAIVDLALDREQFQADLVARYDSQIPPGYKDAGKDDGGVGDLLIWRTILQLASTHENHVIFVSGDEKGDWWQQAEKQSLYPRFELIYEFSRASKGHSLHILKFSQMLTLFGAEENTVSEVKAQEDIQDRTTFKRELRQLNASTLVRRWLRSNLSRCSISYDAKWHFFSSRLS